MNFHHLITSGNFVFSVDEGPLLSEFELSRSGDDTVYLACVSSPEDLERNGNHLTVAFTKEALEAAVVGNVTVEVRDTEGLAHRFTVYSEADVAALLAQDGGSTQ